VDETEPLFAEAARGMYQTGDWITPYFNGETRFDKPPLVYWLMAMGFHLFGVSEWTVRLPSVLAASGLTGLGFYTLRRFGFPHPQGALHPHFRTFWVAAIIGAAAIALNPETIVWARIGVSDMLLSGCIGAALLSFFIAYAQPDFPQRQGRWYIAFYVFMALAVLDKGPVGVVIPGLAVIVFAVYVGKVRELLREIQLVKGGLLFAVISIPWFVLVIMANGQAYIDSFFGYHNFDRFTDVVNGHAAPWFFYFLVVFIGFLPWSPFLPYAIGRLQFWKIGLWRRQPRSHHLDIFALSWFATIFVFFTVAVTKLPSYVLPLMPAAGILTGLLWSERLTLANNNKKPDWGFWLSVGFNVVIFAVLAWVVYYSPNWMGDDPVMPTLPDVVRSSGVMTQAAVIWTLATLAALGLVVTQRVNWLWSINLVAFAAFVIFTLIPTYQLADSLRQQPLREIAGAIAAQRQPNEPTVMVGFMKPSLVFYAEQPITYIGTPQNVAPRLQENTPDATSVLLVGHPEEILAANPNNWPLETLLEAGTYQLVRATL
ncbi:MAG: glycosyltransferase family 39 protein, partial [Cyanobacteria bacterium P01_F01_bin.4]